VYASDRVWASLGCIAGLNRNSRSIRNAANFQNSDRYCIVFSGPSRRGAGSPADTGFAKATKHHPFCSIELSPVWFPDAERLCDLTRMLAPVPDWRYYLLAWAALLTPARLRAISVGWRRWIS